MGSPLRLVLATVSQYTYLDRICYLQLGSGPGVVHGIILEIAISLEWIRHFWSITLRTA